MYIGLQSQIWRNNFKSLLLLAGFPALILGLLWIFLYFTNDKSTYDYSTSSDPTYNENTNSSIENDSKLVNSSSDINLEYIKYINEQFIAIIPFVGGIVLFWFIIAYFSHSAMISRATDSKPLSRNENMRIYNLVENLCISCGMKNPKINIIEDTSLNAFASGINDQTYTISLSRGIIDKLNDDELEGVIAHEITHIRNRDVRLLIISIIFVGIFSFLAEMAYRILFYSGKSSRNDKKDFRILLIGLFLALIGYCLSMLFRFAISRKREYIADAGAATLTKKPKALASALRKIIQDSRIEAITRRDIAQLFIENPQEKNNSFFGVVGLLFATHPPIDKRIQILEQF